MNILDVQNKLKNFSEEQLVQEMQAPTGNAPQFLVLSEIQRRKRMRDDLQQQQAQPVKTVAEEAIAAGGVPQGGIGQLAGAMGQGSSNAQMPQQQAPEQQPQGMYGGGIVKLAPGGAVGGMLSLRGAGDAKAIIVDEDGNPITGPLPSAYAKTIMDKANAARAARNEVPQSEMMAADAAKPSAFANPNVRLNPEQTQPEAPAEPSILDRIKSMFESGDSGPSQEEMMNQGASAPSAFGNSNVRLGQPPDRGGIGAMLEATAQAAPEQTGVTPAATAAMNRSSDANRGVPLAALEERMKKARMNITGPSVFDNPADVMEPPNPLQGISENIGKAPAFNEYSVSKMPSYGPPGSEGQDDRSLAERLGYAVLKDTPIAKTFAEFGNVPSIFDLEPKDTERRDPTGETQKQAAPETTPDSGVQKFNPVADDPKSPGGTAGGGFGAMSSYETELMNMLKSKEKQAEKDKWMSLAKAGLAMMSSKSPNFGVAFGEGAAAGLEDYQAQKSQYETDRLALLGGIEKSRLGREAAARAAQGKPDRLSMNSLYTGLQKQLEAQFRILSDSMYEDEKAAAMAEIKNIRARMSQIESTAGLTDFVAG
jgi:hypothetical protein